jgi:hypothetical protein
MSPGQIRLLLAGLAALSIGGMLQVLYWRWARGAVRARGRERINWGIFWTALQIVGVLSIVAGGLMVLLSLDLWGNLGA